MDGVRQEQLQPAKKRRESLPGRANVDTTTLMVVCVNINGLRRKKKRALLGKLMFDLWAGVCVVTETHLRKPELDRVQIDHYHILADDCRPTPIGERIGGGGPYPCPQHPGGSQRR